jgi:hypothetical protein
MKALDMILVPLGVKPSPKPEMMYMVVEKY